MKLTVFNGSPRGKGGNTKIFLEHFLNGFVTKEGNTYELAYLNHVKDQDRFLELFQKAENVLLAFPLYCDAMPAMVKTFIESLEPLCGRKNNPNIGFMIQNGFPEAIHNRYVARYLEKLSSRLGCEYVGTIIKGGGEGARTMPARYKKPFNILYRLGQIYGETGQYDTELVRKLANPEKFSKPVILLFKLLLKTKPFKIGWDRMLKENGAFERRFNKPYSVESAGR